MPAGTNATPATLAANDRRKLRLTMQQAAAAHASDRESGMAHLNRQSIAPNR